MSATIQRATMLVGLAAGAAALVAVLAQKRAGSSSRNIAPRGEIETHIVAARAFNRSSALLALSVLTDSGIEHYRGSFANKAMFTPLVTSALSLAAGLHGAADSDPRKHWARHAIYLGAASGRDCGYRFSSLQRPQATWWLELGESVLCGADRGTDGIALIRRTRGGCRATARRTRCRTAIAREWQRAARLAYSRPLASSEPWAKWRSCIFAARIRTRRCTRRSLLCRWRLRC